MSQIPVKVTEKQFEQHFAPYLSQAQRGYICQIPLYRVLNYILYWLHTGCQWAELPIAQQLHAEKKKSVTTRSTDTLRAGVAMVVSNGSGNTAFSPSKRTWICRNSTWTARTVWPRKAASPLPIKGARKARPVTSCPSWIGMAMSSLRQAFWLVSTTMHSISKPICKPCSMG